VIGKLTTSLTLLCAVCFLPSVSLAWDHNGYFGSADVSHFGSRLMLDGRLNSGPPCGLVKIVAQLADNRGRQLGTTAYVERWGGGSMLIESQEYSVNAEKSGWHVVWVQAVCQQPN
jgi:hypothetical protein